MSAPDFGSLLSQAGIINFALGAIAMRAWTFARDWWLDRREPELAPHRRPWRTMTLAWALILLSNGYVAIQATDAHNENVALTREVAECNKEFFSVQADRAGWGDQTDKWSNIKTGAIADWLRTIVAPPADEAALRAANDPRYQTWAVGITVHFLGVIDNAQREQDHAIAERQANPLPDPTCGK